jgi:rhodanese-related sulfurtransferase
MMNEERDAMEITPREVRRRLDAGEKLRLIDVREPSEFRQARIDGAELVPMRTVPQHLNRFQTIEETLVVYCHHGVRSLQVIDWLRRQGIEDCLSMAGGIDRWSLDVDPSVPRYV